MTRNVRLRFILQNSVWGELPHPIPAQCGPEFPCIRQSQPPASPYSWISLQPHVLVQRVSSKRRKFFIYLFIFNNWMGHYYFFLFAVVESVFFYRTAPGRFNKCSTSISVGFLLWFLFFNVGLKIFRIDTNRVPPLLKLTAFGSVDFARSARFSVYYAHPRYWRVWSLWWKHLITLP